MTAEDLHWRAPRDGVWWPLYRVAIAIWSQVARVYGVRVHGRERLPADGPVLLVAKHNADIDPPFVNVAAWPRAVVSLARSEHFEGRVLGAVMSALGAVPIRMASADLRALRYATTRLANGGVVAIYPEGVPTFSGELGEFHDGAGLLALGAGVRVVPVAIWGAHRLGRVPLRRGPVHVAFCESFEPPDAGTRRVRASAVTERCRAAIAAEMARLMALDPDRR